MERMRFDLRDTASKALRDYRWRGRDSSLTEQAYCEQMTDVVLAALGLDDIDATVERIAEEREARRLYISTEQVRAVIEALFATEGTGNDGA